MSNETIRLKDAKDALIGALIGLSRAADGPRPGDSACLAAIDGLRASAGDDVSAIRAATGRVQAEKRMLAPDCARCTSPCGRTADVDMSHVWRGDGEVRALKALMLFALQAMAIQARPAEARDIAEACFDGLFAIGSDWRAELLLPVARRIGAAAADLAGAACDDSPTPPQHP